MRFDPAGTERFVAQRLHVLQDRQPGHQTDRQRRMAGAGLIAPPNCRCHSTVFLLSQSLRESENSAGSMAYRLIIND